MSILAYIFEEMLEDSMTRMLAIFDDSEIEIKETTPFYKIAHTCGILEAVTKYYMEKHEICSIPITTSMHSIAKYAATEVNLLRACACSFQSCNRACNHLVRSHTSASIICYDSPKSRPNDIPVKANP